MNACHPKPVPTSGPPFNSPPSNRTYVGQTDFIADGRAWGPRVCVRTQTFPNGDELEGFRPLSHGLGLFVTSNRHNNLTVGRITAAQRKAVTVPQRRLRNSLRTRGAQIKSRQSLPNAPPAEAPRFPFFKAR
jgi:hypothetical protein